MELDDLYLRIFDIDGIPQHPAYRGFSYGIIIVEDEQPKAVFYISEADDAKLRWILQEGRLEFYAAGTEQIEVYYGYVTDGKQFFCEELIFPNQNELI